MNFLVSGAAQPMQARLKGKMQIRQSQPCTCKRATKLCLWALAIIKTRKWRSSLQHWPCSRFTTSNKNFCRRNNLILCSPYNLTKTS